MSRPPAPSLLEKSAWSLAAGVALIAGRFLAGLIVARSLGVERSGQLMYVLWLTELAGQIFYAAFTASYTRSAAGLLGAGRLADLLALRRWLLLPFAGLAGLGALTVALAGRAAGPLDSLALTTLGAFFFLAQALWALNQADFAAQGRFAASARINFAGSLVLVAAVAVGASAFGLVGALASYLLGAATPALWGRWRLGVGQAAALPVADRRALLNFAVKNWIAVVLSAFVWGRVEIWFLEKFCSLRDVAFFAVSMSFVTLAAQGPVLLTDALMPHFAHLAGAGQGDDLRAAHGRALRLMALLLFPLTLGCAALVPTLLPLLYGGDFAPAAGPAAVLVAVAITQVSVTNAALIRGVGRPGFLATSSAIGAGFALLGAAWLIPRAGLWGAVASRATLQAALAAAGFWFVTTRLGARIGWAALVRTALAAALAATGAWTTAALLPAPWSLPAAIPVALALYVVALRAFGRLAIEDAAALAPLVERLPARVRGSSHQLIRWISCR